MASIGFVLSHEQFPAPRLLDLGVAAERAGFDMLWTSDHFHPWMHNQGHASQAWITLAALGQRTERIAFGTGVTALSYRYNPAIVAQAFASLDILYPGRVFLGVGTGEAVNEEAATGEWDEWDHRAGRMVESIQLIRRLWNGEWVTHDGDYYKLQNAHLYDQPTQPIPIYVSAMGPQAMALAGEHGDGLVTDSSKATDQELLKPYEDAARAAGKNPDTMPKLAELFVHVGSKEDAKQAADMWRFIPNAWSDYVEVADPREIRRRAEQEVDLDEVIQMLTVGSDPQTHIDKLQKLIDGGVSHIFVHSGQEDQESVIEFFGREVLPKLQHAPMAVEAV